MLASFSEFDGGQAFFLGMSRPDELLRAQPHNRLGSLPDTNGVLHRNCCEGDGGHCVNGPTSSGSGQTQPQKHSSECQNAQKRFRARQKEKMSCLEREVAEKKAAFEQLAHENLLLRARTNILEKVVSCRDEQLNMVQAFEERCRSGSNTQSCFGGSNTIADGNAAAQDSFRNMKKEQVIPQYKAFLSEVSQYLLHCQYPCCDPNNPMVQKVTTAVERMGYVLKHVVLLNSPLMRQLLMLNLETMQPAAPTEAHWDGVVASLQLGAEQRADILSVLDLYYKLLEKVYEERKLLRAALGEGVGTLSPAAASFALSRHDMAADMELMERLDANLAKEHSAHTLLSCFFLGKVLAPAQFAKVAVYSYPYFPDCLSVAAAVARQAGHARSTAPGTYVFQAAARPVTGGRAASGSGSGSHDSHR